MEETIRYHQSEKQQQCFVITKDNEKYFSSVAHYFQNTHNFGIQKNTNNFLRIIKYAYLNMYKIRIVLSIYA